MFWPKNLAGLIRQWSADTGRVQGRWIRHGRQIRRGQISDRRQIGEGPVGDARPDLEGVGMHPTFHGRSIGRRSIDGHLMVVTAPRRLKNRRISGLKLQTSQNHEGQERAGFSHISSGVQG